MTDLASVALEFAQVSLNWKDAVHGTVKIGSKKHPAILHRLDHIVTLDDLEYTDLNTVLLAVRTWCNRNDMTLFQKFSRDKIATSIQRAGRSRIPDGSDCIWSTDPCHALLSACVMAGRKMGGGV